MGENSGIEIELPIDQGEQAHQPTPKNLLAQDVYKKIVEHLKSSLGKTPSLDSQSDDLDDYRSHEAILIDGGRGTGKSSVLVNLATYLKDDKDLLILKPVDPTLLENGDDLLLNVIVAALMRDKTVRTALQNREKEAEAFYEQLHKLGAALEGIQKQKEQYGLDKLRAFMGNQSLAEHVHILLKKTLSLTGKRLVVLPIDDVDTSLQLAFENIEVVRKYLTSPFVVPLISGDLGLYDEVIWREFHGRLTHQKAAIEEEAETRARDLAEEYQRKILPLPRRIKLPALTSYLQNQKIILTNHGSKIFPLATLQHWLNALLNERVNGEENSRLELPLQTVREMTQFINGCKHLIPALEEHLSLDLNSVSPQTLPTMLKRLLFMPLGIATAVQDFEEEYNKATFSSEPHRRDIRTGKERAYRALGASTAGIPEKFKADFTPYIQQWYKAISDYFQYHRKGGAAYFTASTNEKWLTANSDSKKISVLAHDMFQPLEQSVKKYETFESIAGIKQSWSGVYSSVVPQAWIERIPESTVLSFPIPEKGQRIPIKPSSSWSLNVQTPEALHGKAELARQLLVHWSFYSPNQRANLVLHGRIFELVVASLVRDISEIEIADIINRPPFHSMAALAHTNTLNLSEAFEVSEDEKEEISTEEAVKGDQKTKETISDFTAEINNWRRQHNIQVPHSWLIYNVMNRAFNQISAFSPNKKSNNYSLLEIIDSGMRMFNSVWSAFGSFEKGETFGLPRIIAYVNMSSSSINFEQHAHYRQNILPFLQKINERGQHHNFKTGSYTFALESHPLRALLQEILQRDHPQQKSSKNNQTNEKATRKRTTMTPSTELNKIINATARELGITLKNQSSINALDAATMLRFLNLVLERCNKTLAIEFHKIISGAKVNPGPQRHLQYMHEQFLLRPRGSAGTGPA
ncbi:antiviral RADAR system adenosine triphosphatase RdrA [Pseudomonas sp. NPDC087346]|uniref:antiviral RADAR system adenosine triphosphatase RdrA n=1 Tax=Pseudomonas sp. NPDC087346 TaxID=3364438 RepID=UPI00382AB6AF